MKWTSTTPTKPGYYAWRRPEYPFQISLAQVDFIDGRLAVFFTGEGGDATLSKVSGEWLRLVPAEEVEKAYREGFQDRNALKAPSFENESFGNSRAKQIAEGTE